MEPGGDDGSKDFNRSLAEQKLRSFSIGNMGSRGLSRKEQEEMRKRQAQEEVGKVYQEFVSTFEDNPQSKLNKTWVKAGTFNAGNRKEDSTDKGKLYRPQAKLDILPKDVKPIDKSPLDANKRPEKPGKKKQETKKKSNLEIFKEELKAIQEEREERHRVKGMLRTSLGSSGLGGGGGGSSGSGGGGGSHAADPFSRGGREERGAASALLADVSGGLGGSGSHDTGDPTTTNLYLGNLSPRLTEKELMEIFGRYGPLASIKIMWPRTEDEKSRGRNCGFAAYMSRKDGERALKYLLGKEIDGFEMKMGWGKPVPIPLHPIYVPPTMLKLTMPPEPTGLPFNCQPPPETAEKLGLPNGPLVRPNLANEEEREKYNRVIHKSKVIVMIPFDRQQLCLINRMVEFVVREGPMFEAMIMNREMNNRNFRFLFDNQSPEHIYYRWRLFSLLQGDTKDEWRTEEFRMFKGGSVWKPPTKNIFNSGMPEELVEYDDRDRLRQEKDQGKARTDDRPSVTSSVSTTTTKAPKGLSDSQRDRFEDMLRNLLPDRNPVAETMVWCMEHAEACDEIVECISESLSILQTPITKKVARLYLISDILHNCSIKGVPNVSYFRKSFQVKLPEIFTDLNSCYSKIDSRIRAEAFKQRVMSCFRAWEDWAIYPQDFLIQLQNIFLGLTATIGEDRDSDDPKMSRKNGKEADDGKSLSGEDDVDGVPLDGAALLKSAKKGQSRRHSDSDVDGTPLDESSSKSKQSTSRQGLPAGFVPSKWETVDPEEVQAQAVTSKWDIFDQEDQKKPKPGGRDDDDDDDDTDIDGVPMEDDNQMDFRMSENRRAKLREVELDVMRYQDALESGKQTIKPGWTVSEQVEQYRRKMVKLATSQLKDAFRGSATGGGSGHGSVSATGASNTPRQTGDRSSEDESSRGRTSNRSRAKKKRQSSRSRGKGRSSSSSRSRSRDRKRSSRRTGESARRRSSSSSSDDRRSSKRRRSRSPSSRKHKKKRH